MSVRLVLEIIEFVDTTKWTWRLRTESGSTLAEHAVLLDQNSAEYEAAWDPESYIDRHSPRDMRDQRAPQIVRDIGDWLSTNVLGPIGEHITRLRLPVVVRVVLNSVTFPISHLPIETARVNAKALALQDVTFVYEFGVSSNQALVPARSTIRILAVFTSPNDASALSVRRERAELTRLVRRISGTHGVAIELRLLQYGVTRHALREVMEDGDGWDVLHFSGHGLATSVVLETSTGAADTIDSAHFVELLRPSRATLRLVVLSACLSARAGLAEVRRWAGLGGGETAAGSETERHSVMPDVARAVLQEIGCAVLAMRYTVDDDFSIALAAELYESLFGRRQSLARALQLALPRVLAVAETSGLPSLSLGTPALFGVSAGDLRMEGGSPAEATFAVPPIGYALFPPEPRHFVGRVSAIARARSAFAPDSEKRCVLFCGMVGAGKTSCALELAYAYQSGRFRGFVWYKAPDEAADPVTALADLAMTMERQLPGFQMAHVIGSERDIEAWSLRLSQLLKQSSLLLVLDNVESLLDEGGEWRDRRWSHVIEAIINHAGLSRAVITSRRAPRQLSGHPAVMAEWIHALSVDESLLLIAELPNMGRLLRSSVGGDRDLIRQVLRLTQGHPKLIELLDREAADADALGRELSIRTTSWSNDAQLDAFLLKGESVVEVSSFLDVLRSWVFRSIEPLDETCVSIFRFLCILEEQDREEWVLVTVWAAEPDQSQADIASCIERITASGLMQRGEIATGTVRYYVHPAVAAVVREHAGESERHTTDERMGRFWAVVCRTAMQNEVQRRGGAVVNRAGRSAVPYLLRTRRWRAAGLLLQEVINRDDSPRTVVELLPQIRRVAEATRDTADGVPAAGLLATGLRKATRWSEAEAVLENGISRAVALGLHRDAAGLTGELFEIRRHTGRVREALDLLDSMRSHVTTAGLGQWTRMGIESRRLQALNNLGEYRSVLNDAVPLYERIRGWSDTSPDEELNDPWSVREAILTAAVIAATQLRESERALDLNHELAALRVNRGAPQLVVARTWLDDYPSLVHLNRFDDVRRLLAACRRVFEAEGDFHGIAQALEASAHVELRQGRSGEAVKLGTTSLGYFYRTTRPEPCANAHHNLGLFLSRASGPSKTAVGHLFAAAILYLFIQSPRFETTVRVLQEGAKRAGPNSLPSDFREVCSIVEKVDGVLYRALTTSLCSSEDDVIRAFDSVVDRCRGR